MIWPNCATILLDAFLPKLGFAGRYPAILTDDVVGEAAANLFNDAQAMLDQMIDEKWLTAKAVIGFWPATRDGDDIVVSLMKRAVRSARVCIRCANNAA